MATNMKKAQELIFDSLGATNVKLFPGFDRGASAEAIANEVTKAIDQVANGEAEEFAFA